MKLYCIKLGSDLNKTDKGFSGQGGGWDLYKMFYKNSEFYFNINTKTGEAEIEAKDYGYADELLEALAKTLKGEDLEVEIKTTRYYEN